MLSIIKVTGNSMQPKIAAGDFVIASRFFFTLNCYDTVIVDHPIYNRIIKRVEKICPKNGLWLSGYSIESITPEEIGWVSRAQLRGKVISIVKNRKRQS